MSWGGWLGRGGMEVDWSVLIVCSARGVGNVAVVSIRV